LTTLSLAPLFLAVSLISIAQEEFEEEIVEEEIIEKSHMTLKELFKQLQGDESECFFTDVEFIAAEEDDVFLENKEGLIYIYTLKPVNPSPKFIYFNDCIFNTGVQSQLVFEGWDFKKLNMLGCETGSKLIFLNCTQSGNYPIHLENCILGDDLVFDNEEVVLNRIEVVNSRFDKTFIVNASIGSLIINGSVFKGDPVKFQAEDEELTHYQLALSEKEFGELIVRNCKFYSQGIATLFSMNLYKCSIDKLVLLNDSMHSLNFTDATINKSLLIDSIYVRDYIGVQNFDFPESNTNIPWYNLSGEKLAIFYTEQSHLVIPYQAKSEDQITKTLMFNDLISAYNKFNSMYHGRGDIGSANASYVEIKDIETRRQKYLVKTQPTLNLYLNYKLNIILRFFSDYATNPGKSLIQSLWVLVIFSIIYMFTFSEWDGLNYVYFKRQFILFSRYMKTKKSLKELYTKDIEKEESDFLRFKAKYIDSGKKLPRIIRLLGNVIFHMGLLQLRFTPYVYEKIDFKRSKWVELSPVRKAILGLFVFLLVVFYLLFIMVLKFINGFILSLNSFGFINVGTLPDGGIAMYFSVIESITGWFLLTIFTITLLSQILQSG